MPRPFASLDAKLLGQSNLPFVFLLDVFVENMCQIVDVIELRLPLLRPQINHLSLQIFSSGHGETRSFRILFYQERFMDMDYVADAVVYEHERTLKNTRKRLSMCTEVCA